MQYSSNFTSSLQHFATLATDKLPQRFYAEVDGGTQNNRHVSLAGMHASLFRFLPNHHLLLFKHF